MDTTGGARSIKPQEVKREKVREVRFNGLPLRQDALETAFFWNSRKRIESGQFGTVYSSECRKPPRTLTCAIPPMVKGKLYAIKVIPKTKLRSTKQCRNIAHEIEILSRVHHSSIVQFYDAFQTPLEVCIVLELVEDGELFKVIAERQRLTEAEAQDITRQLMEVLCYLHNEVKVVHRDLKPENILITRDTMKIKLIDFGYAKFFGKEVAAKIKALTPSPPDATRKALSQRLPPPPAQGGGSSPLPPSASASATAPAPHPAPVVRPEATEGVHESASSQTAKIPASTGEPVPEGPGKGSGPPQPQPKPVSGRRRLTDLVMEKLRGPSSPKGPTSPSSGDKQQPKPTPAPQPEGKAEATEPPPPSAPASAPSTTPAPAPAPAPAAPPTTASADAAQGPPQAPPTATHSGVRPASAARIAGGAGGPQLSLKGAPRLSKDKNMRREAKFGAAVVSDSPMTYTPSAGTLKYQPPETLIALVRDGIKPRSTTRMEIQKLDIFAAGVVVYLMLGGVFPFSGRDAASLQYRIHHGVRFDASLFPNVSEDAKDFVRMLLWEDRARRPLAVQSLQHTWMQLAGQTPTPEEASASPEFSPLIEVSNIGSVPRGAELYSQLRHAEKELELEDVDAADDPEEQAEDSPEGESSPEQQAD